MAEPVFNAIHFARKVVVGDSPQDIGLFDLAHFGSVVELEGGHTHGLGHAGHGHHTAVEVDIDIGVPLLEHVVLCGVVAHAAFQLECVGIDDHRVLFGIYPAGLNIEGGSQGLLVVQDVGKAYLDIGVVNVGIHVEVVHFDIKAATLHLNAYQFGHFAALSFGGESQCHV